MPSFDIVKKYRPAKTYRTEAIKGAFDIRDEHLQEHFAGDIDIDGKEWNVGLIVGGSGTGKSTIARELFGEKLKAGYVYTCESVIDDMPKGASVLEIEQAFTAVGFSSPPSWLKPYAVLSNGEKMRCDIARAILENEDLIAIDEFTSVVNREVAKAASYAISKNVRRNGKKFVAVSCHDDIVDWLEPDWIYSTDEKSFFGFGVNENAPKSKYKSSALTTLLRGQYGKYLGSIII